MSHSPEPAPNDELPIESWVARGEKVLEKRLTRLQLTAQREFADGTTVAERVVAMTRVFNENLRTSKHDDRLSYLLMTCDDPMGPAATWLRAAFPSNFQKLSKAQRIGAQTQALERTLLRENDPIKRMKWARLALGAADWVLSGDNDSSSQEHVIALMTQAWQALPVDLRLGEHAFAHAFEGNDAWRNTKKPTPVWQGMAHYFMALMSTLKWERTPASLLPMQLWLVGDFKSYSLVGQQYAAQHQGLHDQCVGHTAFERALDERTPWPADPRVAVSLDWIRVHNPLLVASVEGGYLAAQTPSSLTPAPLRHRL